MTACVLSGLDWYLNTVPIVAVTLTFRWIAVGVWHEYEHQRQRDERRRWLREQHDRDRP